MPARRLRMPARQGLLVLTTLALLGCAGTRGTAAEDANTEARADGTMQTYDASRLLAHTAEQVIVPLYSDLAAASRELDTRVQNLTDSPSAERVEAARAAWRAMRQPWERSEAFLYGPVATEGHDPRLDSWPLDVRELEQVMARNDSPAQSAIDDLDDNLRGYHTVEYLLWDDGGDDPRASAAAVARALQVSGARRAYLRGVARDMRQTAAALVHAWQSDGGDFQRQLATAGEGSRIYGSQRAALQEIIQGMIGIAGEVAGAKLGDPLEQGSQQIVESKHSSNSRADFSDNIRGIKHVYLGDYPFQGEGGADGVGVSDYVQTLAGRALDASIRRQIDTAIERIEAIDQPYHEAIVGSDAQRDEIRTAIAAVTRLRDSLRERVLPLLDRTRFAG